jgi:hypothetical protein
VKTLTRNLRDHKRTGTHKHTVFKTWNAVDEWGVGSIVM